MPRPHRLRHRFEGYSSRLTTAREAILELMSISSEHMSAKEIYASLQGSYPGMGLSTVCRTLDLLVRMGIVTRLSIGDGQSRYEIKLKGKEDYHHHLICTNCGKIINYSEFVDEELYLVKKTEERLAKKYNFIIRDHNIEFLGLCEKCKGKKHNKENK